MPIPIFSFNRMHSWFKKKISDFNNTAVSSLILPSLSDGSVASEVRCLASHPFLKKNKCLTQTFFQINNIKWRWSSYSLSQPVWCALYDEYLTTRPPGFDSRHEEEIFCFQHVETGAGAHPASSSLQASHTARSNNSLSTSTDIFLKKEFIKLWCNFVPPFRCLSVRCTIIQAGLNHTS